MSDYDFENLGTGDEAPIQKVCSKCGAPLEEGQAFCPKCGQPVNGKPSRGKGKGVFIVAGILAVAAAALAVVLVIRGKQVESVSLSETSITLKEGERQELTYTIDPSDAKNQDVTWKSSDASVADVHKGIVAGFKEGDCTVSITTDNGKEATCKVTVTPAGPDLASIFDEYCDFSFASIASDGSYLNIDTNPLDIDDYSDDSALSALLEVTDALGLPESVINRMGHTSAMDGTQSYSTDELDITWSYHPDNGLEVSFSLK